MSHFLQWASFEKKFSNIDVFFVSIVLLNGYYKYVVLLCKNIFQSHSKELEVAGYHLKKVVSLRWTANSSFDFRRRTWQLVDMTDGELEPRSHHVSKSVLLWECLLKHYLHIDDRDLCQNSLCDATLHLEFFSVQYRTLLPYILRWQESLRAIPLDATSVGFAKEMLNELSKRLNASKMRKSMC